MSAAALTAPHFHDEDAARRFLETIRWPDGPVCPKCGTVDHAYATKKSGVYRCAEKACRKDFSVTISTVFERSHIPIHKWLMAAHLMTASKKGVSSHQLHRMLGITYKSAWFLSHRLREAMSNGTFGGPLGGEGKTVEADETFWGNASKKPEGARGFHHKMKVFTLIERDGDARSFHVANVTAATLRPILKKQIDAATAVMTDDAFQYRKLGEDFPHHASVNHSAGEYARREGDRTAHTNTAESYFAILKRGLYGTFHHVSEAHLKRYCGEFDFRWNHRHLTDAERAIAALARIPGKRLTYGGSHAGRPQ